MGVSQLATKVGADVSLHTVLKAVALQEQVHSLDRWLLGLGVKHPYLACLAVHNEEVGSVAVSAFYDGLVWRGGDGHLTVLAL